MSTDNKFTAFQVITFLQSAVTKGDVKADDAEGLEVAIQCIAEAFGVDPEKEEDKKAYSIEPATLPSVLAAHKAATPAAAPAAAPKVVTPELKAQAETQKAEGNKKMAQKDYAGAIAAYGKAIDIDGNNPVYWSNRAAAHSQVSAHSDAISDARSALAVDPSFSKAYSRLGHALFSSGEYAEAVDAYEKGLVLDPNNATMKSSLATAKSRVPASTSTDDADDDSSSPVPRAGGAPAFPGFPGMGGGGMPDIASMMQNPAIMQMAQSMMANGGLESLMSNPALQQMMNGAGGAGGMPDINALMQDPTMRRMAEQFGASMGGGAGGRRNDDSSNSDNMYS